MSSRQGIGGGCFLILFVVCVLLALAYLAANGWEIPNDIQECHSGPDWQFECK